MKTIYKYVLSAHEEQDVWMHDEAQVLSVQNKGGVLCMWVIVDTDQPKRPRKVQVCGTGNRLPDTLFNYAGTVQMGPFVWHVFVQPSLREILREIA